jgi:hypothetical protein
MFLRNALQRDFLLFGLPPCSRSKSGETRSKKSIFPTKAKRETSGQSNFIGKRTEKRFIVTKSRQRKMTSVIVASLTSSLPSL